MKRSDHLLKGRGGKKREDWEEAVRRREAAATQSHFVVLERAPGLRRWHKWNKEEEVSSGRGWSEGKKEGAKVEEEKEKEKRLKISKIEKNEFGGRRRERRKIDKGDRIGSEEGERMRTRELPGIKECRGVIGRNMEEEEEEEEGKAGKALASRVDGKKKTSGRIENEEKNECVLLEGLKRMLEQQEQHEALMNKCLLMLRQQRQHVATSTWQGGPSPSLCDLCQHNSNDADESRELCREVCCLRKKQQQQQTCLRQQQQELLELKQQQRSCLLHNQQLLTQLTHFRHKTSTHPSSSSSPTNTLSSHPPSPSPPSLHSRLPPIVAPSPPLPPPPSPPLPFSCPSDSPFPPLIFPSCSPPPSHNLPFPIPPLPPICLFPPPSPSHSLSHLSPPSLPPPSPPYKSAASEALRVMERTLEDTCVNLEVLCLQQLTCLRHWQCCRERLSRMCEQLRQWCCRLEMSCQQLMKHTTDGSFLVDCFLVDCFLVDYFLG